MANKTLYRVNKNNGEYSVIFDVVNFTDTYYETAQRAKIYIDTNEEYLTEEQPEEEIV